MTWSDSTTTEPVYRPVLGRGPRRFTVTGHRVVKLVTMSAKRADANDLTTLCIMSDQLKVPLKYDFDDETVSLTVRAG